MKSFWFSIIIINILNSKSNLNLENTDSGKDLGSNGPVTVLGGFKTSLKNSYYSKGKISFYYQYLLYRKTADLSSAAKGLKLIGDCPVETRGIDNLVQSNSMALKKTEFNSEADSSLNQGVSLLGLYFNQTISSKTNNFQRQLQISKLKETFFPYRKSFLCYWLLPFVGFVYSAELAARVKPVFPTYAGNSNFVNAYEDKIGNAVLGEKHVFNFASSLTALNSSSNFTENLTEQNLNNVYAWNLKQKEHPLSLVKQQVEQTELLRYCVFYFSSLENYLTNSNSNVLGANQTQTFLNASSVPTLNFNSQDSVLNVFLKTSQQSAKFKWIWYNLPISHHKSPLEAHPGFSLFKTEDANLFHGKNSSDFHLKLDLGLSDRWHTVGDLPQSPKGQKGKINGAYTSLDNPISSYLKATRLLDVYSNKNESIETLTNSPVVSTPLFEKFFSYNTLLNQTKQPESFKPFSSLFLKEGLLSSIRSEENKDIVINPSKQGISNSFKGSLTPVDGNSIIYEKFSKKKLYSYLFESLQKTMESSKTLSIYKTGVAKATNILQSKTSLKSVNSLNSLEKQNSISNVLLLNKQYIKYTHPLLMSSDTNGSGNTISKTVNNILGTPTTNAHLVKTNSAFYLGNESSISLKTLNVQETEKGSTVGNKNVSLKLTEGIPAISLKHSPSKFLTIYETKIKDFLVVNSINVSNPVTSKLTTLLGNDTNDLYKIKQLNLILEKTQTFTNSNHSVQSSLGALGVEVPRVSKIEKVLRAYFSQKNSGFSFGSSGSLVKSGVNSDVLTSKTLSVNEKKSRSPHSKVSLTLLKPVAYLQTHLRILKNKMYNNLNNISKLETKSFWLKSNNFKLKVEKVSSTLLKTHLLETGEFRKTKSNLKAFQLFETLNSLGRPLGRKLTTKNRKFVLSSNNTIRILMGERINSSEPSSNEANLTGRFAGKTISTIRKQLKPSKFSPRLLVNSRLLVTKAGLALNFTNDVSTNPFMNTEESLNLKPMTLENLFGDQNETNSKTEKSSRLYNVLKSNQKKRRRKKIKKETRRRKKRKRFYPRPSWIRFQLYKTISQNRYNTKTSNVVRDKLERIYHNHNANDFSSTLVLSKAQDRAFQSSFSNSLFYGTDKTAFTISGSVSRELKRSLWKSYWLRSNLTQYLMNVETSLTNIKESTQSWEFFKNIRTFMSYVLGFNSDFNPAYIGNNLSNSNLLLNSGLKENPNLNKWETALYLAEYNKISTARLQQWISQIRENLTLNGQIKIRSSNVLPLTNNITQVTKNSVNKNSDSMQVNKLLSLFNPNSNASLLMPSASQLRYYWAFSKTSTATTKDFALDDKKWTTTKMREQTKNNKTKKLSKDASTYLQTMLNERSFVINYKEKHLNDFSTQFLTNKKFFNVEFLLNLKGNENSPEGFLSNSDLNTSKSSNASNEALIKLLEKSLRKVRQQEEKLQILGYPKLSSNLPGFLTPSEGIKQSFVPNNRSIFASANENIFGKKAFDLHNTNFAFLPPKGATHRSFFEFSNGLKKNLMPSSSFVMAERSYVKLTNKSSYWWSANGAFPWDSPRESSSLNNYFNNVRGHLNFYSFYQNTILENPFNSVSSSNPAVTLWTSALLFHFCTLLSIFSISQIRGLFKFYLLILSKVYKTSVQVLGLTVDSISRLKFDQFTTLKSTGYGSVRKLGFKETSIQDQSPPWDACKAGLPGESPVENFNGANISSNTTALKNLKSFTKKGKYKQYDTTKRHFYTFTQGVAYATLGNVDNRELDKNFTVPMVESKGLLKTGNLQGFSPHNPYGKLVETRLFLYYLVNACLKKPLYLFAGNKLASKSIQAKTNLSSEDKLKGTQNLNISQIQVLKTAATLKTLLFMNVLLDNTNTVYTKTSKLLKEAKTQVFEGSLRSIYTFLEKPGELIIDWIAYLFLVEWASDMTNTVPENLDLAIGKTSYKITRNLHFLNASALFFSLQNSVVTPSLALKTNQNFLDFMILGNTFLQYRFYHLYEILLMQFYQPDTDLIVRQKKGVIFWDIWGDFLTQVAEDSNINISELTSLKEEQIRLFEKCEALTESNLPFSFRNYAASLKQVGDNSPSKNTNENTVETSKNQFNFGFKGLSGSSPAPTPDKEIQKDNTAKGGFLNFANTNQTLGTKKFGLVSSIQTVLKQSNRKALKSSQMGIAVKSPLAEPADRVYLDPSYFEFENNLLLNTKNNTTVTWGAQQFLSYQGKDTELFIDLHPRGSLELVSLLKSNSSIQQPIGSLVCQIFSGLLSKQISKNMLIVGSYNNRLEKTLLVQAIAGETELKIITDSAYRYAMVYRGVAVGIKLLRDVFDSLVATGPPCLFLIEDIHAIGERRPMLISDDENSSETSQAKSDEIHEKNQVLYQLSKHMITHYKKPYKGDFSLLIPTNHFCFDFFLGVLSREGSQTYPSRKHPVSSKIAVNSNSTNQGESSFEKTLKEIGSSGTESRTASSTSSQNKLLTSRLHIKKSELLAPPATSPFSVLTLKEEKKFKPTKLVKEMPWAGLPGEQYSNLISSKASYSIRVKVALLADMAISSLSVKLDMITDLLVIIDSVKGNRGFVVFATTHVPYILDPALRRPGRFDETISLGLFPTVFSRWEVLKSAFSNLNSGFSPSQTYPLSIDFSSYLKESLTTNLQTNYNANPFSIQQIQKTLFSSIAASTTLGHISMLNSSDLSKNGTLKGKGELKVQEGEGTSLEGNLQKAKSYFSEKFSKQKRKILSQTYFNASQMLVSATLSSANKTSYQTVEATDQGYIANSSLNNPKQSLKGQFTKGQGEAWEGLLDFTFEFAHDNSRFISLYASPKHFKNHLVHLISGKLGEIFLFTGSELNMNNFTLNNDLSLEGSLNHESSLKLPHFISSGIYSSTGLATWQALTALIQSFIHKRFIYHTNLIVPKLLNFTNYSSLLEPSSPPSSSILLPARRYENYRRSLAQYTQKRKTSMSIFETIQLHQQQRNVKRLYRLPVQESFRSEIIENRLTGFSNASNMIGTHEAVLQKPTSTNWFVRNRIFMRHQNYLTNQWWNGQLPEHNAETTYLSDIDWRYTFIESIGDLSFDFPDADQHYSPRNRRWLLTNGSYQNWFDFDKSLNSEIYSHLIFESFVKAFHIFEQNREILDFYAFYVLKNGVNNVKLSHESVKLNQRFFN